MDSYETIARHFQETLETIAMSVDTLAPGIAAGGSVMTNALLNDGKIISCGNGPDALVAQLFTSHLLSRYEADRPALPAFALGTDSTATSAIAQISGSSDIFSRPVRALGNEADIFFCISSGDSAPNLPRAVQAARERNMSIVLLSNTQEHELPALLEPDDIAIQVESEHRGKTIEMHTMIIHCLCELIDQSLFGPFSDTP